MGALAVKEAVPMVIQVLPHLQAAYQFMKKECRQDEAERQKAREALRIIEQHHDNLNAIIQNQAEMSKALAGMQVLLDQTHQAHQAHQAHQGTVTRTHQRHPRDTHQDVHITMTQQQLQELISLVNQAMLTGTRPPPQYVQGGRNNDEDSLSDHILAPNMQSPTSLLVRCSDCDLSFNTDDRQPIILPCGHTFCKMCVTQMSFPELKCPTCHKRCETPPARLPVNYTMLQLVSQVERAHTASQGARTDRRPGNTSSQEPIYEDEDLRLAQLLQEEEMRRAWGRRKKCDDYMDRSQETDVKRSRNCHRTKGALGEEGNRYSNDFDREGDQRRTQKSYNNNANLDSHSCDTNRTRWKEDIDSDSPEAPCTNAASNHRKKYYGECQQSDEDDDPENTKNYPCNGKVDLLAMALSQEEQEKREKYRRRMHLKEQEDMDLAIALSLSLENSKKQDMDTNNEGSDYDDK